MLRQDEHGKKEEQRASGCFVDGPEISDIMGLGKTGGASYAG
jgi:hypothetical protein